MNNEYLKIMKTNIQNMFSESRSYSDVVFDCRSTVVRPSFDRRSALLKMVAVLVMIFTLGVGQMWGAEDDPHDFAQDPSLHGLNKCAGIDDIDIAAQSYPVKEVIITYAYNKSNSPSFTVTVNDEDWGTKTIAGTGNTTSYSTLSFTGDAVTGAVNIHFNTGSSCSGTGKGSISISNVRLVEGSSGGGGCTAGDASSIKAGDVVLIYYPSASKEFGGYLESGDSHWGDIHAYTGTPSGYYPFTVEAGSASGYWSFKNGSTYLAMSENANNRLVGSATINDASSWSVSINGSTKEATITNKAYGTRLLKYNSDSPRFSSYESSTQNTHLPKIYKYCGDVKYRVTYYGNGSTSGSVPTDATGYDANANVTVLGNTGTLAKIGSTFAGWNTKADGTGTSYSAGNNFTITSSVSLYAKWSSQMDVASVGHVTITATPAGGSAVAEGSNTNVENGKTVTLGLSGLDAGYTADWDVYKTGESSTKVTVSGSGNGATFVMPTYPVTVSATITAPWIYFTSCGAVECDDKYCIDAYDIGGGDDMRCFTQVGSSNIWTLANYDIPNGYQDDGNTDFWIGYDGAFVSGKSANWHFRWVPFKNLCGTYKLGLAAEAIGTLTIDASTSGSDHNYGVTFDPNGYGIVYGTDPAPWTSLAFTQDLGDANVWNTSIVNVSDVIGHNYYVGLLKKGGGYVFSDNYDNGDEHIQGISQTTTISGMGVVSDLTANPVTFRVGGLSSSDGTAGMRGYFQIWNNNCNKNFYCHFVPVYTITYKSYDGSSTLYTETVSAGESFTVRAAETGAVGWAESSGQSAASSNYTVSSSYTPTGDVTLYVACAAYTVNYTATSGTIERESVTVSSDVVIAGNSVTLPTVTGVGLACAKFIGWYAGDYNNSSKPAFLAAGSTYEPTGNVTLKALYAIVGDNYELVTSPSSLVVGSQVVFAYRGWDDDFDAYYPVAISETQLANTRDVYDWTSSKVSLNADGTIITWLEATPDAAEFIVEAGSSNGTYAFYAETVYDANGDAADPGYIYCASSSSNAYFRTQSTKNADASWSITISDGEATMVSQKDMGSWATKRNVLMYNSTNDIWNCYASNYAGKKPSIFQRSISNYTTSPACTTYSVTLCSPAPSNGTISASSATVSPGGYTTISFTPDANYMLDAVTVTSGMADAPAAPVYSSGPTSAGTVRINNISSDITVCATFKAIPRYTVTFVDVDNSNNTVAATQQASYGANVATPSSVAPHTPCDGTWSFVGWCPSNSLNGSTTEPTGFVAAGGTISGALLDDDVTYYSVYTNSSDGSTAFDIGKSGRYYLYALDGATKHYATTWASATKLYDGYDNFATYPKSVLTLTYNSGTGKYKIHNTTIKQSDGSDKSGYLYQSINSSKDITVNEPTNYTEFTITTGTAAGSFRITYSYWSNSVLKTGNFGRSSGFQGYAAGYDVYFEPATSIYYYNASSCTDLVTMTFHPLAGGDPTWAEGHPKGEYTNVPKGTISTFPTDTYSDWTFIGWTAGQSYNDNREDAGEELNDDNGSATEPTQTIYSTGGNVYSLQANVDMYPVFTKFLDNEPFDQINGGDYYIYYIADGDIGTSQDAYGANNRMYAGSYGSHSVYSATTSCASATLFTFTKLPNGKWTIYDNDNNDGTIANPKKYLCGDSEGGNDLKLKATATAANRGEWTITVHNGNQFDAVSVDGQTLSASTTTALSGSFKNYDSSNFSNGNESQYHRVYIGSCTERIYSSDPTNTPHIDLKGTVKVTSTATKSVKARTTLTVSASKISTANLAVTSDNSAFKFSLSENGSYTASVNIPVVSNKVGVTPIYIEYTPAAGSTSDGIEDATITVSDGAGTPTSVSTTAGDVQGRHVPANFVIAAKWGDKWYALPANCTDNTSSTAGVLLEVDNASDPTAATYAPAYTKYGLQPVRPGRYADKGSRLVFTERLTDENTENQLTLFNGATTSIQVNAMYKNYVGSNPEGTIAKYEWIPTSSDLKDYVLTSAAEDGRTISLNNDGVFGTLLQDKSYDGKVRLLPTTFFEDNVHVLEWKASSVVVMYTGSGVTATTKVGTNSEGDAQTLTAKKIDHGVFELTTAQALTSNTNGVLQIAIKNGSDAVVGKKLLTIPAIINIDKNADDVVSGADEAEKIAKAVLTDVVILDGKTLSAVATKYTFKNITVYPGGKLVIGAGKQLGMNSLTLRGGSSWGAAEYEYKYPQFVVNNTTSGAYSNSAATINYDYVTTKDQYYSFVLPYNGLTNQIKYPVDIYGSNVAANNTGSFEFQYYNGAARASGGTGWKTLAEPATLVAGTGYTFLGMPKKVDAYNGTDDSHSTLRQRYGIHRIPMSVSASSVQSGENPSDPGKAITIAVTLADKNNDSGWNLVGNPYLSEVSGLSNSDIQVGQLVHTNTTPWDGKWQWDDANPSTGVRYIVQTDDGQTYRSEQASTATLPAFKNFFVQISNSSATSMTIPKGSRSGIALIRARNGNEIEKDIQLAVDLLSDERKDKVDLLINDIYTAEFDQDGDFTKMMNKTNFNIYGVYPGDNLSFIAIDKATAEESIAIGFQVPEAGDYTLQLSDREYVMADAIEALYVTDHEVTPEFTTDLLNDTYSFGVKQAERNDTRFTLKIVLKDEAQVPTDVGNIDGMESEHPLKFLYRDKLYILRNGVLYDATGKRVK